MGVVFLLTSAQQAQTQVSWKFDDPDKIVHSRRQTAAHLGSFNPPFSFLLTIKTVIAIDTF